MYINPDECVDCGACRVIFKMDAIFYESDLPEGQQRHLADNAAFFTEVLPARRAAGRAGRGRGGRPRIGVDTPLVTGLAGGES